MKTMVTWNVKSGKFAEATKAFLGGLGEPTGGIKRLGRWHSVDIGSGFVLFEADDATQIFRNASRWADLIDVKVSIVADDHEVGPLLAEKYKQ